MFRSRFLKSLAAYANFYFSAFFVILLLLFLGKHYGLVLFLIIIFIIITIDWNLSFRFTKTDDQVLQCQRPGSRSWTFRCWATAEYENVQSPEKLLHCWICTVFGTVIKCFFFLINFVQFLVVEENISIFKMVNWIKVHCYFIQYFLSLWAFQRPKSRSCNDITL